MRHKSVKLYTLFKTEDPENDTLMGGTSLYRKYMGVPPPPPPPPHTHTHTHTQTHTPGLGDAAGEIRNGSLLGVKGKFEILIRPSATIIS